MTLRPVSVTLVHELSLQFCRRVLKRTEAASGYPERASFHPYETHKSDIEIYTIIICIM